MEFPAENNLFSDFDFDLSNNILLRTPFDQFYGGDDLQSFLVESTQSKKETATQPDDVTGASTPVFSDDSSLDEEQSTTVSKKRSASTETSDALVPRPNKVPRFETEEQREEYVKTRAKGACLECQKSRKKCSPGPDPDSPCQRCLDNWDRNPTLAMVYQPCWRVKISDIGIFRRGPTVEYAWSRRWLNAKADGNQKQMYQKFKKSITNTSSRRRSQPKEIHLTQGWSSKYLTLEVDQYQPTATDKQYYEWFDGGEKKLYHTPPYSVADPDDANHAIGIFIENNMEEYIVSHTRNSSPVVKRQFLMAKKSIDKPLIHLVLKLWVACRFIETPWNIVGSESLGMTPDTEPNSPYHGKVPVTPMMDHQIDNVVIHNHLQPLLAKITKILDKLRNRVRSSGRKDWLEIQLAYFVLMHNIELTVAHDIEFARRYNLSTQFSNMPLINMLVHGANTLLTYFHHAHQGSAPFSESDEAIERLSDLSAPQKAYMKEFRGLLQGLRGDYVHNPGKELFWTSQLFKPEWRPVVFVA